MNKLRATVIGLEIDGIERFAKLKFENCSSPAYAELKIKLVPTDAPRLGEVYVFELHDIKEIEAV